MGKQSLVCCACMLIGGLAMVWDPPAAAAAPDPCAPRPVELVNPSFEVPSGIRGAGRLVAPDDVPGWSSLPAGQDLEIWGPGNAWADNGVEVVAADGKQFVELEAAQPVTLLQEVPTVPGTLLRWSIAHRARDHNADTNVATMYVMVGAPGQEAPMVPDGATSPYVTDGDAAWTVRTGGYRVPAGQTVTRFVFRPLPEPGQGQTHGNFIDDFQIKVTGCVPTPGPSPSAPRPPYVSPAGAATLPVSGIPAHLVTVGFGLVLTGLALLAALRRYRT